MREEEILQLLASGLEISLIKERLAIRANTVKKHIEDTYRKLAVHSRYQAVAWAWKNGLAEKSSKPGK
ncbi:MAG: LuxR C-terminal-related transcriptional regulator [Coprothermobacterota bacterium]|nr:LuxR C-terminal-related transcriptional regulator [Coprothermobacterota bacterium]